MNYIIRPDGRHADLFGFTSDKFDGWMWREGGVIVLTLVISKSSTKDALKDLVNRILEEGFTIKIRAPLAPMRKFAEKNGFIPSIEWGASDRRIDVWVKSPQASQIEQKS